MPLTCLICNRGISRLSTSLSCSICFSCYHQSCLGISFETFNIYNKPSSNWICPDHSVGMSDSKTSPLTTVNNKNVNSTKKQLTLDDLAKLINTLSSSQNKGFESINKRIDDMIVHLSKLDSDLDDCRKKIDNLEERVIVLETRNTADTTTEPKDMSLQIINEVIDIQKRSVNIIIHGLDESPSMDTNECTKFDTSAINKLFSVCSVCPDNIINVSRLGRLIANKTRPIKLLLRNQCDVNSFISSFLKTKRKSPSSVNNISVVKDRSQTERRHIKNVYTDYHNRVNSGEQNIRVLYINGLPRIVTTGSKN